MTPSQIQRIRESFATAVLKLDEVSRAFCQRLLRLDPSLGTPFGGDPVAQRIKVGAAFQLGRIFDGEMRHCSSRHAFYLTC